MNGHGDTCACGQCDPYPDWSDEEARLPRLPSAKEVRNLSALEAVALAASMNSKTIAEGNPMGVRVGMTVKVLDYNSGRFGQYGRVASTMIQDGKYLVDFGGGDTDWVSAYPDKLAIDV